MDVNVDSNSDQEEIIMLSSESDSPPSHGIFRSETKGEKNINKLKEHSPLIVEISSDSDVSPRKRKRSSGRVNTSSKHSYGTTKKVEQIELSSLSSSTESEIHSLESEEEEDLYYQSPPLVP